MKILTYLIRKNDRLFIFCDAHYSQIGRYLWRGSKHHPPLIQSERFYLFWKIPVGKVSKESSSHSLRDDGNWGRDTHTPTQTHTIIQTHTHTHTYAYAYTYICIPQGRVQGVWDRWPSYQTPIKNIHICTHTHIHIDIHTYIHICTHTHTYIPQGRVQGVWGRWPSYQTLI